VEKPKLISRYFEKPTPKPILTFEKPTKKPKTDTDLKTDTDPALMHNTTCNDVVRLVGRCAHREVNRCHFMFLIVYWLTVMFVGSL